MTLISVLSAKGIVVSEINVVLNLCFNFVIN